MAEQNLAMHVQRSRSGTATEVEGGIFEKADRYLSELGRWYRRLSAPVITIPSGTYQRVSSHCYSSFLVCRSDTSLSRTRRLSLVEFSDSDVTVENRRFSSPECPTTENNGIESSMEIDTSSLSCDRSNHPHCDHPCSGSYQPLPPESLQHTHSRASPGCMKYMTVSRPVWRAIVFGQLMSLLLCAMAVSSYYLNSVHHLVMPTGQSFIHYSLMCMIYTTWLACRSGENGLVSVLRRRGWRYLLIALADVEASTLLITAHQFTTLTSIQLLDCVSIPAALALSCLLLRVRYKMVHIVGVSVCLMGVGCLVWADIEDGRPLAGGKNRLLGDMLCLGGAILFSIVTVAEEYTVKTFDWVEYLGMVGLFGSVFNGLQLALLEKQELSTLKWDSISLISLMVGFGLAQFLFHSIAPAVLKDSGATALQLSLLTADFYSLIVGIILLQYKFHALYFLSFTLTMTGVLLYAIKRTPISSQQTANYRGMSRNHTSSFNMELAPSTTPVSGHASVSLSRATLAGSTDTGLSGSGISQGLRLNGVTVF